MQLRQWHGGDAQARGGGVLQVRADVREVYEGHWRWGAVAGAVAGGPRLFFFSPPPSWKGERVVSRGSPRSSDRNRSFLPESSLHFSKKLSGGVVGREWKDLRGKGGCFLGGLSQEIL